MTSKITNKIGSKTYTEIYTNEYDRADRIVKTKHKYGNTEVVLLENSYDDLGRLVNSRRLQKDALKTQVGYTLHSSVNSLKTSSYFEEKLHFEDSSNGNTPLYSGSISGIEWMVKGGVQRGYNYAYDKNKRLTKADYYDFVGGEGRFSTSYGYDNMGNITSLKRSGNHNNGSYGVIDDLTYSYNGYQLVSVDDAATSPDINDSFDFKDGADASVEYLYDANGNMVQDKNKGIAQIQYNHLNMPTRITYDNGNMIDYLYSASGVKLEVTHTTNKLLMVNSNIGNSAAAKVLQQTTDLLTIDEPALAGRTSVQAPAASNLDVQTTDYINGYILENGALSQIQLNGGYMTEDSQGKAVYHFYLQDHQGNNRVVVNGKTLAVEQVNHYYPYGGLFAESTGGEMQAFKYNGKELDRVCGLNWYDHGARHNDAAIGRWHCIDPLAEKYYSISPYAYCAGDPVNFGDYNGMDTLHFTMQNGQNIANYESFIAAEGNHVGIVFDEEGNQVFQFSFASQDGVREKFENVELEGIMLVSKDQIGNLLEKIPQDKDLIQGALFALNNSRGLNAPMDFVNYPFVTSNGSNLFIPMDGANVAHDTSNFGNYLWGSAMKKLGIPYPIAVAGAHYDNWKSSFLSKGQADSLDDQYSIALGYSGGNKTQSLVRVY